MCMEDIRIGRKSQGAEKLIAVGQDVVTLIAPYSEYRTYLLVTMVSGNFVWVSSNQPSGRSLGYTLQNSTLYRLEVDIDRHGDLVQKPWYAWADAAAVLYVQIVQLPEV